MGICFHNAGKYNVVTGTNFDEEGPFNQGVLNRLGTRSEKKRDYVGNIAKGTTDPRVEFILAK